MKEVCITVIYMLGRDKTCGVWIRLASALCIWFGDVHLEHENEFHWGDTSKKHDGENEQFLVIFLVTSTSPNPVLKAA